MVSLAFAIPQTITAQAAQKATRDQGDNLRQQQITDRFSTAIQQLGNRDNLVLRLGGIYSLNRIIQDSPQDQPTVVNVLTTFVREATERGPQGACSSRPPAVDVQAALTVVADRKPQRNDPDIDLSNACLAHASFTHAKLARADFTDADLHGASFDGATLDGSLFDNADLRGASFVGGNGLYVGAGHFVGPVDLQMASFRNANLTGNSSFRGANLHNAFFNGANLTGTDLTHANLGNAFFNGANLTHANLTHDTNLDGADFNGANLTGNSLGCRTVPYEDGTPATLSCH